MSGQSRIRNERGAIVIHVAFALIALLAFTAFVVDQGLMLVSRRQAQNAADSGALAGALSLLFDGGTEAKAEVAALHWTATNYIWGEANSSVTGGNVQVAFSNSTTSIAPCNNTPGCVRVDVFRNMPDRGGVIVGNQLPVFFSRIVGLTAQGVRATATAQTASGNSVSCMLPFAVIDRWADNYDPSPVTTYFADDGLTGTAGWTPNDDYQPTASPADVYVPPYGNNPAHTGWQVSKDYGRQLVLKDGSPGNYSTGWANLIYFPGSSGASDVKDDIVTCDSAGVGLATASNPCTVADEAHGCIDIKTGVAAGPISSGVNAVVGYDPAAAWSPTADGPNGPGKGAVVGGQGMASPRIRAISIIDINHYDASGCTGSTCIAKVANIVGFFLEGMCEDVTLDAGLACDDPTKDVVGRIVTLPGSSLSGVGSVDNSASFIKIVRLVR